MKPTRKEVRKVAEEVTKRLSDEGRLIEAGWVIFRGQVVPPDAPEVQVQDMRFAWMAASQHLWASVMSILDPGEEPTDQDLARMDLINKELGDFVEELKADPRFAKA